MRFFALFAVLFAATSADACNNAGIRLGVFNSYSQRPTTVILPNTDVGCYHGAGVDVGVGVIPAPAVGGYGYSRAAALVQFNRQAYVAPAFAVVNQHHRSGLLDRIRFNLQANRAQRQFNRHSANIRIAPIVVGVRH